MTQTLETLRKSVLKTLLDDLAINSKAGIPDESCQRVTDALQATIAAFSAKDLADPEANALLRKVRQTMEQFRDIYKDWNKVKGQDREAQLEREALHEKLRKIREGRLARNQPSRRNALKAARKKTRKDNPSLRGKTLARAARTRSKVIYDEQRNALKVITPDRFDPIPTHFKNLASHSALYFQNLNRKLN